MALGRISRQIQSILFIGLRPEELQDEVTTVYRKRTVLISITMLLIAGHGVCKCAKRIIFVDGTVLGPITDDLKVLVEVTPDPNSEVQPEIVIKDGKFVGKVYFDATKSEGRVRDDCSRVPETVEILLLKNGHEVNRVRIDVSKGFTRNKLHDYTPRSPIILHVPG